ncbi:hypothetical protein QAD02_006040 [Eretmocerus hayati]|uniref:Uncharacterized protein n=1 Tax=Eretmocerus hayati TaxID=131215 RepID=A0ACC2N0B1_9HYME|nr:hypothetical protein QAD02_006040 [Eretmocerus hayati]
MELSCCLCPEIFTGIDNLGQHLAHFHGVSRTKNLGDTGFVCGHGNCREAFDIFSNLRRHIKNVHMVAVAGDQPPHDDASNFGDGMDHDGLRGPSPIIEVDVENGLEHPMRQPSDDESVEMEVDL